MLLMLPKLARSHLAGFLAGGTDCKLRARVNDLFILFVNSVDFFLSSEFVNATRLDVNHNGNPLVCLMAARSR